MNLVLYSAHHWGSAWLTRPLRQLFGPSQPYEQQCTVMLFSHRLLAFPQADLVVVLDRGRILEQGTHAELAPATDSTPASTGPSVLPAQSSVTKVDTR